MKIASQLDPVRNEVIRGMLPELDIEFVEIPRGAPVTFDPTIEVFFAWPFRKAGQPDAPVPPGWPFGLKWVQLVSAGLDPYPDWLFEGPRVSNAAGTLAVPIAEFCLALILAAAKRLPETWIESPEGWRLRKLAAVENATLGILGFGAIGENLAKRALALGMKVHAARRSDAPLIPGVARAGGIESLMEISDHLVLAAPATSRTRCLVNDKVLARAKPGLHLINVARGALVDNEALIRALDAGRLSLASLDVADPEPLPAGHPFYTHPRIRLSPHTSPMSDDADVRVARLFADNLRRYLAGRELINAVAGRE